ncbi:short-chain dehydrogenase [Rhodanobacter thiooxydans]|uniref:Short-chain dehydrogenase n=1 Tax=Rhodanobacter thiooxydans TaxID=416169 RepID=A0A154QE13_9GAMM|nr:SDR family NAD(P)-dependent oxidoreductase [Rhodanobacter thiooxydans]EIL97006.1 short-chain dehydrogenase/reductase SDR [Rhodanobacter thiooxydans LCS2]KZC22496.1 short-chain dehydrogenase [Rhodanobacter thiooxydans]MCW0200594.1 SDR family NAD(P)-dependent oxidoreductase [Rhodanobacter thiooxydans]
MSRPARRTPAATPVITPVYRVALVSGANRGLGFEVARQLSEYGMTVLLGARDLDKGLHAARQLAGAAGEVIAVQLDVTRQDQVDTLAHWIELTWGRLDVLINNAGGYYDHDAQASDGDLTPALAAMQTHLFGSWRLCSALLPLMRRHGYGRIVNVSSGCAASGSNGGTCVAYRTSKSALNAYTRTLAAELEGSGIAVNAVCPGWVATELGGPGGRPISLGAAGIVWAASLPAPAPTGRFFRDGEAIPW